MTQKGRKLISTVKQIENLKPGTGRYEIPDATVRGLRLCVFTTGKQSWVYRYRLGGRTRKLTLECGATDLARARKLASDAMNAVASKVDPGDQKKARKLAGVALTVEGLIKQFVEKHLGKVEDKKTGDVTYKLDSGREVERILRKELKKYLNRQAEGGISGTEAVALIKAIGERGTVIRNRSLTALKLLYGFGMHIEVKACTSSPFAGLELKDEGDGRDRVLSKVELKAVWVAAAKLGEPYCSIIRLLALTGQRLNEIAKLRWSDIDWQEKQIVRPATGRARKNRKANITALSDQAMAIIKAAPKVKSETDLIFTLTGGKLTVGQKMRNRLYKAVEDELGYKPEQWQPHDLRRTMTTRMASDLKVPEHIADRILNHSANKAKGVVAKIYNRYEYADERRDALMAWGRYVDNLVNGAPDNVVQLRA
jgi:integrase